MQMPVFFRTEWCELLQAYANISLAKCTPSEGFSDWVGIGSPVRTEAPPQAGWAADFPESNA